MVKAQKKKCVLGCILLIIPVLVNCFGVVEIGFALLREDRDEFAQNNILFYDPGDIERCQDGTSIEVVSSLPQDTIDYFTRNNILEKAEVKKELYEYAASETGLPWQALAAIDFRENTMTPGSSMLNGAPIRDEPYENDDGKTVLPDEKQDAVAAAKALIRLARDVYTVDILGLPLVGNWAKAFLAYNRGFMYKDANESYTKSPYVMNGYDSNHLLGMKWIHADSYLEGAVDRKPGALAVFIYLGGTLKSGGSCEHYAPENPTVDFEGNTYTFPLAGATKANIVMPGRSSFPCEGAKCHYNSYKAVDISVKASEAGYREYTSSDYQEYKPELFGSVTKWDAPFYSMGVAVVAPVSGVIIYNDDNYSGERYCASIGFKGDDGIKYWLGHTVYDPAVKAGDRFEVGQKITEVGPPICANKEKGQTSVSHLHIHSEIGNCNSSHPDGCTDAALQVINYTYEALPDE